MVVMIKFRLPGEPKRIEDVSALDFDVPDVLHVYCAKGKREFVHRIDMRYVKYLRVVADLYEKVEK